MIKQELEALKTKGQLRKIPDIQSKSDGKIVIAGKEYINFASNDYLGLSTKDDLRNSLDKCADIQPDEILKRAELIFDFQYEKYREYFISDKDKDLFINIINELEKHFSSPFTVISQNNELILKSNLDSEISYKIDIHYNVQAYKGTNIVDLDEILFKYPDEFQFYQKLFYFLRDDINIQNLDMSFEK